VQTTIVYESITGRKWKNADKKSRRSGEKTGGFRVDLVHFRATAFCAFQAVGLFKPFRLLNRLGFETRYTNRSRDPGEKCHHSGDALTISFRRFKSISEAAFFVTFCIKCRWKISATAAQQTKTRLS
jgi:hypothetical protein